MSLFDTGQDALFGPPVKTLDWRILVTGSRGFSDRPLLETAFCDALDKAGIYEGIVTVVTGGARGADRLAESVARELGWAVESHPADWDKNGKAAGFIRNQGMVDAGAAVCVALLVRGLPCRGTKDCMRRAGKAGIPVLVFEQGADR